MYAIELVLKPLRRHLARLVARGLALIERVANPIVPSCITCAGPA